MAEDKRLDTLQEEIKLMKGELKQSLASVRDYLLNMELPSSEISSILSELSESTQKVTMTGSLGVPSKEKLPQEPEDAFSETEDEQALEDEDEPAPEGDDLLDLEEPEDPKEEEPDTELEDSLTAEDDVEELTPEDTISAPEETVEDEPEEELMPEPEMSFDEEQPMQEEEPMEEEPTMQEEQPMQYNESAEDASLSVPKVNMLANLINWVARANKEIGRDQIPIFLEVYGISGHLSPELKEVILHLAEITTSEPDIASSTEIWSQAMLLLHGILTGGDAPLHPIIPSWNNEADMEKPSAEEEIIEVDKSKEKSVKLKLVLPDDDGEDKEFCINLTPEAESRQRK